jgi:hypothetical protein
MPRSSIIRRGLTETLFFRAIHKRLDLHGRSDGWSATKHFLAKQFSNLQPLERKTFVLFERTNVGSFIEIARE